MPDQVIDGKKYYAGIPDRLEGSRLKVKSPEAKVVKAGMKDKKSPRVHDVQNRGPLPSRTDF
jgi:hypothetical protein